MAGTPTLLERIDGYIESLFVPADAALARGLAASQAAGLPAIHVSPTEGKLLSLLVSMSGARRVLEIGTLGGYSTAWLARGLPKDGRIVTLELDPTHADVARRNLDGSVTGVMIDIRVGPAADTLRALIAAREPAFDFIFIDADKPGYPAYLDLGIQLSRPGTVIVADNVIRNGAVLDEPPGDENARAARRFNAALAGDHRLESIVVPIVRQYVDGISISLVKR